MSMTKQQTIGAVGAGVFVLCAGALGYLCWDAMSGLAEAEEELVGAQETYKNFSKGIFPSAEAIKAVKANASAYRAWYTNAVALAAAGDFKAAEETAPQFKQRLQDEVTGLVKLPGGVSGALAQPTFLFGFDRILGENGVMPESREVPTLVVQLDTVSRVAHILSESGVLEMTAVNCLPPPKEEDESAPKKGKKKVAAQKAAAEEGPKTTVLTYAFEFTTRGAALVEALNRLAAEKRFFTVTSLAFNPSADTIGDHLTAIKQAQDEARQAKAAAAENGGTATGGRRRGRRSGSFDAEVENPTTLDVDPLVTDPESDAPLAVSLTITVHDFGRATVKASTEDAVPQNSESKVQSPESKVQPEASK